SERGVSLGRRHEGCGEERGSSCRASEFEVAQASRGEGRMRGPSENRLIATPLCLTEFRRTAIRRSRRRWYSNRSFDAPLFRSLLVVCAVVVWQQMIGINDDRPDDFAAFSSPDKRS